MLHPIDRARIRVESGCDDATIRRYPNVSGASQRRIERAAERLGITLPASNAGDTSSDGGTYTTRTVSVYPNRAERASR